MTKAEAAAKLREEYRKISYDCPRAKKIRQELGRLSQKGTRARKHPFKLRGDALQAVIALKAMREMDAELSRIVG